jgi:L-iditol 2-dehydrogenase
MVRAAVMVEPGRLEVREFPFPELEEGAALMRVELCGICGTDKHTWRGETAQYAGTAAASVTPFPIIPGHEVVGVLTEINDRRRPRLDFNGERLRPGDRVVLCPDVICGECYACRHTFAFPWCEHLRGYGNSLSAAEPPHLFGGWAEYLYVLPAAFLYKVPEDLPPRVAVMAELMAVSYNLDKVKELFTMAGEGFATGDAVVVQGVGPMFQVWFSETPIHDYRDAAPHLNSPKYAALAHALHERGVMVHPSNIELWFVSTVHTEDDVDATLTAFEDAVAATASDLAS